MIWLWRALGAVCAAELGRGGEGSASYSLLMTAATLKGVDGRAMGVGETGASPELGSTRSLVSARGMPTTAQSDVELPSSS
jgi:hypothetical protein